MSHKPGSTVMPSVEMTSAPFGTASVPTWPTAEILSPSMRMTLFWIGGPAKPSTSVPPTSAFTRVVEDGCPCITMAAATTSAALRQTWNLRMAITPMAEARMLPRACADVSPYHSG